jgi:hypothetical protein
MSLCIAAAEKNRKFFFTLRLMPMNSVRALPSISWHISLKTAGQLRSDGTVTNGVYVTKRAQSGHGRSVKDVHPGRLTFHLHVEHVVYDS